LYFVDILRVCGKRGWKRVGDGNREVSLADWRVWLLCSVQVCARCVCGLLRGVRRFVVIRDCASMQQVKANGSRRRRGCRKVSD
jgi:hypothetical protein